MIVATASLLRPTQKRNDHDVVVQRILALRFIGYPALMAPLSSYLELQDETLAVNLDCEVRLAQNDTGIDHASFYLNGICLLSLRSAAIVQFLDKKWALRCQSSASELMPIQ